MPPAVDIASIEALRIAEADGRDEVRFLAHRIDGVHIEAARRLLVQFQPHMTCMYKSMVQRGKYPLGVCSTIASLANLDRERFEQFVAIARTGQIATTVTKLEHLSTSVPNNVHDPSFCVGISDAFLNPCPDPDMVQMSTEFDAFPIANDSKTIVFQLMCNTKAPKMVTLRCSEIYRAFQAKCAENKRFIATVRKLLDTTLSANIELKTTRYSGHKIFVHPEEASDGSFVTLYVIRHMTKRQQPQLAIAAVDIRTHILDDTDLQNDLDECVVCMEELGTANLWKCSCCHNAMHQVCASKWLQTCNSCPFCRNPHKP